MNREIEAIKLLLREDCISNCQPNKSCELCEAEKLYEAGYRKQETCRDLADDFDEFKCSECGYQCDDTNSCKKDDDGEIFHFDFQFKFCPNCGRKVEN